MPQAKRKYSNPSRGSVYRSTTTKKPLSPPKDEVHSFID